MPSAFSTVPRQPSADTLRSAQAAFADYYDRCFWFMNPDLHVTAENLPRIIEGLRRAGDRRAWRLAEELCR